ncbi:MAG: PIN domain-containing protein [Blastocatellia bacterium]
MSDRVLVDTNILVYAYDADAGSKQIKAAEVLDALWVQGNGVLATQVLAEFFVTITKKVKQRLAVQDALQIIEDYCNGWTILNTTSDVVIKAIAGVEQYRLSFWDAMIWAAAAVNEVTVIYSEDMQDGQMIEGVRIENPLII